MFFSQMLHGFVVRMGIDPDMAASSAAKFQHLHE